MSKYGPRGLNEAEISFRHKAREVTKALQTSMPTVTYCMVLRLMRKVRDGALTEEQMGAELRKMLALRPKRLKRRKKASMKAAAAKKETQ